MPLPAVLRITHVFRARAFRRARLPRMRCAFCSGLRITHARFATPRRCCAFWLDAAALVFLAFPLHALLLHARLRFVPPFAFWGCCAWVPARLPRTRLPACLLPRARSRATRYHRGTRACPCRALLPPCCQRLVSGYMRTLPAHTRGFGGGPFALHAATFLHTHLTYPHTFIPLPLAFA